MPRHRLLRALLLLALGAAACERPAPDVVYVGDGSPRGVDGKGMNAVIQTMLDELPPPRVRIVPWGLYGRPYDGNIISEASQAAVFSAADSVVAVVGHSGSKSTLLAAPIYRAAGMPLIVPMATAGELREMGSGLFLLAPPDDSTGAFLVDHALDSLGAKRLAMIYIADPYGNGIHAGVTERLRNRGVDLAGEAALSGTECSAGRSLALYSIVRALVARVRPDAVIIVLPQFQTMCAIGALLTASPGVRILTGDSFVPQEAVREFTDAERRAVRYLVFWRPGSDSLSRVFSAHIRAALGRDPSAGQALTLDAYLLVAAAAREGNTTRGSISNWLSRLGTPGHPPVLGVSGPIDFQRPRTAILHLERLADLPPRAPAPRPR